jgi:hypothetical protein
MIFLGDVNIKFMSGHGFSKGFLGIVLHLQARPRALPGVGGEKTHDSTGATTVALFHDSQTVVQISLEFRHGLLSVLHGDEAYDGRRHELGKGVIVRNRHTDIKRGRLGLWL